MLFCFVASFFTFYLLMISFVTIFYSKYYAKLLTAFLVVSYAHAILLYLCEMARILCESTRSFTLYYFKHIDLYPKFRKIYSAILFMIVFCSILDSFIRS